MRFQVRRAYSCDYQAACRLWAEADALHAAELPRLFRPTDLPARSRRWFDQNVEDPEGDLLLAEADGAVVALVRVQIHERPTIPDVPALVPRRYAAIEELVVAEAFRRRGIAALLMDAAHHWMRDQGIDETELTVYEFNQPALRLYRKLGYQAKTRRLWRRLDEPGA